MHQGAPAQVINYPVHRLTTFADREGDRAMRDTERKIIGSVDRIQYPGETRRHRYRIVGLSEFFAEVLIVRILRCEAPKNILGNGHIDRRYPSAVVFPFALGAAKLAMHELGLRKDNLLGCIDAGGKFRRGHASRVTHSAAADVNQIAPIVGGECRLACSQATHAEAPRPPTRIASRNK